ncbi:hypothetical protein JCM8547_009070 [Rhodosporidiobolus lusitaniae]
MSRSSSSAALATLLLLACQATTVFGAVFNCVGGSVRVIAHADDDLLFQSPDLLTDMQSGCDTTIIMTAGDSGTTGTTYLGQRELGNQAGYAQMAGVANTWTEISAIFGGQPAIVRTLVGAPGIQKVYFRLPDGNMDGSGFSTTGYQSLRMLYFGSISTITNQPKTATYTLATLKQAISEIISARRPSHVRTLDYMSDYDAGDHADHLTVGRLTAEIAGKYASNATLDGYMGYPVQNLPPTMQTTDSTFIAKSNAFFAYTPYDSAECQAYLTCVAAGRGESYWLVRQYAVNEYLAEQSYMGSAEAPVTLPNGTNIARRATVTASSDWDTQPATAAIDGYVQGYPGNASAEWSTYGETVGAWIQLDLDQTYTVTDIVLNDRPNLNDWMTGGTLTFADNSTVSFGALANDGSATLISLGGSGGTVVTDSIFLYVTSVSGATGQVGLAEFQVFGTPCPGCAFSSDLTAATTTQTSSGTTTGADASTDLALAATATASSAFDAQGPEKAIDGYVDGYKEDGSGIATEEWASYGEGSGAYLNLTWPAYYMVDSLVLYDRPNQADQVTSGRIDFSDGSSLPITSLDNSGGATVFNLSEPVNISSLLFTVTGVSDSTSSVGLAEIEAFYSLPQTPVNITSSDSADATVLPVAGDLDDETWADDLALADGVVATASSLVDGQDPGNLINGDANGYKEDGSGDPYQEWATFGEKAGAWAKLTFPQTIQVNQISLFDRPNFADQVTGAKLTFSDGSFVAIGALNNDGTATNFSIPGTVTDSILFTVTKVSSTTSSVGLSEFAVFGSVVGGNSTNTTSSTPLYGSSTLNETLALTNSTAFLNSTLTNSTSSLLNSTSSLLNSTSGYLNSTGTYLNGTYYNATSSLNGTYYNATSSLYNSTSSLYNSTASLVNSTAAGLANATSSLANSTSSLYNSTVSGLTNATSSLANSTSSLYNGTVSGLTNATSSLANSTSSLYNSTASGLTNATSSLANTTSSLYNSTTGALSNGTASLANGTSSLLNSTTAGASNLLSSLLPSATKNASSSALPTASSIAFNVSSSAVATGSVASSLRSAASSAASSLSSQASSALSSASSAASVSASKASSSASVLASSASSVASSASSVISSAASVSASASIRSSSAFSSALSSSGGMVTSVRSSSAAVSTAASSSATSSSVASSSSAAPTGLPTAAAQAATVNIARLTGVTVTAKSSISKSPATGANDGKVGGLSALGFGQASQEWVATSGKAGEWIEFTFPENYLIRDLVIYPRVSTSLVSGVTSWALNATDGTVVKIGQPASAGSHVSFGNGITVSGIRLTATGVLPLTSAVGLAEVEIYNRAAPTANLIGNLGNAVGTTLSGLLAGLGL